MIGHSIDITDAVAEVSPVLWRMRLDGLARATVPFEERYVLAWLGGPEIGMPPEMILNCIKV